MHRFLLLLSLLLFVPLNQLFSQDYHARVIDAQTKKPVPYANVVFGEHKGVVTNEEGFFSFNFVQQKPESVQISSLGYEPVEIAIDSLQNLVISLSPSTIELKEVFVSNKNLSPLEIIKKVKEEISNNFDLGLGQKRIFFRESSFNNIKKFKLKVEESTIEGIDQNLMNRLTEEMPKFTDSYREVLGDLYGNYDKQKLHIVKAANLYDPKESQSVEQIVHQMETLFRDNLKKKSFLKIKSGWLGVKVDADELEKGMADLENEKKEKTPEEKAEYKAKNKIFLQKSTATNINSLLANVFWKENIPFNLFEKTRKYEFNLKGYLHLDDEVVYVIEFQPKRKADYKGTIYVNSLDYGVHRLEYENVRPLKHFRLLGVSKTDDVYRGKMIFTRNESGKYSISYLEQEKGQTVGIDRPLTIIEKNRHVPGRNKQNELDMDLDLLLGVVTKVQMLIYDDKSITESDYEILPAEDTFEYQAFNSYNPDFWKGNNIIEPNEAIKQFTAMED
ncbi:MAG: carboxypeptidase-like regulatory domain-containing protein [Salinimicrobium sp.]